MVIDNLLYQDRGDFQPIETAIGENGGWLVVGSEDQSDVA
jgi:hypothetical protein